MIGCRPLPRPSSVVYACLACALFVFARPALAVPAQPEVRVVSDASGQRLQVGGRDFLVKGVNWDYMPIGDNYSYDFWNQPDDMIRAALAREMGLLRAMGANSIRQYVGIPPRWVKYIYETYGIWTVLNHPLGRYGFTIDGVWHPVIDYSDPKMTGPIQADFLATVEKFKDTPGVLMWLLGNENNYGLSWKSFEIEALPVGERDAARAKHLYAFFGQVIDATHAADAARPVAMANGDVQYIDLIAQECKGLDIFGTNVYRGVSVRDLYDVVKTKLGKPVLFTEFGSDAFNARELREDQGMQARYLTGQWQEIHEMTAGKGRAENAIGGLVFQWSDGWWKFGQESRLDIHDTNASWPNGGYDDFVPGMNNMNEEWWGICAKGPADGQGLYDLYPRAAYYTLQKVFGLDPYSAGTDTSTIRAQFATIDVASAVVQARGNAAALGVAETERVRVSGLRMQFETITTGAAGTTTPLNQGVGTSRPAFQGFDQLQSYYVDLEARPAGNVSGKLSVNLLGKVPGNPIDEIFYESRGKGTDEATSERVKAYNASLYWEEPDFRLEGFYRTGHYHWGYEGDFFGFYREANYGPNIDTYNADVPIGMEITGRRRFEGLKLAFGPELWWGANPAILAKYRRRVGRFDATAIYQEDLTRQTSLTSSAAVPVPATRKASLHLATPFSIFNAELGGIWSGQDRVGDRFVIVDRQPTDDIIKTDKVFKSDAFGGKLRLTLERGRFRWYGQTARMGLVADGGPTQTITYTGWGLKDSGLGNQTNVISGFTYNTGNFQLGPNFLWQKPTVGPIPSDVDQFAHPNVFPRNVSVNGDPFAVRSNREMTGGELVIGYDPTPATWLWAWDNDVREDAKLAGSLSLVTRHMPTTQDAGTGVFLIGNQLIPGSFGGAPPAHDLWEARLRVVSKWSAKTRLIAVLYTGTGESNGIDPRIIKRTGLDARLATGKMAFAGAARFNDWGPYDYHRDFNLTFPMQLMGDVSRTLGGPRWFGQPQTRVGMRAVYRTLDQDSNRYDDPNLLEGYEYEFRTYLHLAM